MRVLVRPNIGTILADVMALHWANAILHGASTGCQYRPNKMPLCKVVLDQNCFTVWVQLNMM